MKNPEPVEPEEPRPVTPEQPESDPVAAEEPGYVPSSSQPPASEQSAPEPTAPRPTGPRPSAPRPPASGPARPHQKMANPFPAHPLSSPQVPPWHGASPDLRGKRPSSHPMPTHPPDPITLWARRYLPFSTGAAPRVTIAIGLVVAVFTTFVATSGLPGIGISITGIAILAMGLALVQRDQIAIRGIGAILTVGLFAVPTFIDEGTLVAVCVLAGLGALAATLAPPKRFTGFLLGPFAAFTSWYGGLAWAKRGLATMPGRRQSMLILRTALIAIVMCVVFGALFASADPAFADLVDSFIPSMSPGLIILRIVLFPFALAVVFAYAHNAVSPPRLDLVGARPAKTVGRWEWAVPLGMLNALFAVFVAVQAVAFFRGSEYIKQTTGMTYAEYARGGFWQLCWITVLTLVVIAVAVRKAPRRDRFDRLLLRAQLGVLCGLSLVIVASALHRMSLYEEAYGLTRLRVWIFAAELWLGLVFLLVMAAGFKLRATWLPRTVAASGAAMLIALAVVNPDALIAQRNVDRYLAGEHSHIDLRYLSGLSTDAVPALDRLSDSDRSKVMANMDCHPGDSQDDGSLSWNYSRARAYASSPYC